MSEDRAERNDDRKWENIEFTTSPTTAIVDYTINTLTGTETETTKYLNKGSLGTGFVLRPSATVSIVSIGKKVFRNPIMVSTEGMTVSKHLEDFSSIVIRTTATSTILRLIIT